MPSPKHPANGWRRRWLETFSLRGLALLADSWSTDPPFKDDSGFGAAIAVYRQNILEHYGKLAAEQGNSNNLSAWFKQHRAVMEAQPFLNAFAQAASLSILAEYERNPACIEALGALNRWRGRSAIALEEYFRAWEKSCRELQASADLPTRLRNLLGLTARPPRRSPRRAAHAR